MRDGACWEQTTPELRTEGSDSGSWRTPTAEDSQDREFARNSRGEPKSYGSNQGGSAGRVGPVRESLETMARHGSWPTPRQTDGTHGGRVTERKGREGGNLVEAVSARLWPTPSVCGNYNRVGVSPKSGDGLATAVSEWATPTAHPRTPSPRKVHHGEQLANQVAERGGDATQPKTLNPEWVEWLMGWPIGWTGLRPLETVRSASVQRWRFDFWLNKFSETSR
jgi:hypothetical protein